MSNISDYEKRLSILHSKCPNKKNTNIMNKYMLQLITMAPGLYLSKVLGDVADFGNDDEAIVFDSRNQASEYAAQRLSRYPLFVVPCTDERSGRFCTQESLLEKIFIDDRVL